MTFLFYKLSSCEWEEFPMIQKGFFLKVSTISENRIPLIWQISEWNINMNHYTGNFIIAGTPDEYTYAQMQHDGHA